MAHEPRVDYGDPNGVPKQRKQSTKDAHEDLTKPIWQLVGDVHEEINRTGRSPEENLNHALKRTASLMGRVAVAHERVGWWLITLTVVLAILTAALIWIDWSHHSEMKRDEQQAPLVVPQPQTREAARP